MQPALHDDPRRSRGVWGPSLADNRPRIRKSEFRIANEPLRNLSRAGAGANEHNTKAIGRLGRPMVACSGLNQTRARVLAALKAEMKLTAKTTPSHGSEPKSAHKPFPNRAQNPRISNDTGRPDPPTGPPWGGVPRTQLEDGAQGLESLSQAR